MYGLCRCGCRGATDLAPRTDAAKGWVKDQPKPYLPQHSTRRWTLEGECWVWGRTLNKDGYGRIHVDGRHRLAHRVYYEAWYGPVDEDKLLFNACGRRDCVRPDHWSVRMSDTIRRCASCRRQFPLEEFKVRVKERGYRSSYCRKCFSYRERNRKRGVPTDNSTPWHVWQKSDGSCHRCGRDWSYDSYGLRGWHVDHVVPLSRGGSDLLDNKRVACAGCNLSKGAKLMEELVDELH